MRIGVLTGGGDCPGLNAVIRAVVRKGEVEHGDTFVGFRDGWKGLTENLTRPLDVELCRGILPRGGTILGTSRTNPYKVEGGVEAVHDTLKQNDIDALVAIGGDDTLGVAYKLSQSGVHVVGVPKTIDNDLSATDVTFGFHTAVQIATDAIDRLHTTAESHDRVFVCEVMGRHAGWIAMYAGMAGGAAEILIPEKPFDIDEVAAKIKQRHSKGRYASIVVVAEGAVREGRHPVRRQRQGRRLRSRATRWHRPGRGRRTRRAHRLRDARDRAGPHPARRNADRVRPRAGHPLRVTGHRRRARERLRDDGRPQG